MAYCSPLLERRILDLYHSAGIERAHDITLYVFDQVIPVEGVRRRGPTLAVCRDGRYFIFYDPHLSLPIRRVQVAHEIGHAFLHIGMQPWVPEDEKGRQEWQAEQFAAYALTPGPFVLPLIRQCGPCGQREIDDLAHEFGVTPEFMTRRLQDLQSGFRQEAHP